jgi:hypothetical protein
MINFKYTDQKTRLGTLLVKNHCISKNQLDQALIYQSKRKIKLGTSLVELNFLTRNQLNFALKKQTWVRAITTMLAITFAPFNVAFASDLLKKSNTSQLETNIALNHTNNISTFYSNNNQYINNVYYSVINLKEESNNFYYSKTSDNRAFTFNKKLSDNSALQLSLFAPYKTVSNQLNFIEPNYKFEPEISFFKSSSKPSKTNHFTNKIRSGINHYRNTIPAVFMLSLKGRCLYENSGNDTTLWSLNRAKKGVQRKAVLMFSVTKQF